MDWTEPKQTEMDKVDRTGPKCSTDVAQKEYCKNKWYASTFRYYIEAA